MIALYWNFFVLKTSQAKTVEVIGQQKRPEKAAATPIGMTYLITFIRLQKCFEIAAPICIDTPALPVLTPQK